MGRQKAVIKARREAKRVIRRDARSHRQLEEESVTSLVQMGGVESIGMARDKRDSSPIEARTEAQGHYLSAIENKQLIFATGEAGCGKTFISAAKAAEAELWLDGGHNPAGGAAVAAAARRASGLAHGCSWSFEGMDG